MTTLDPAYCADGCGRLAETERPMGVTEGGDLSVELVCRGCALQASDPRGLPTYNPLSLDAFSDPTPDFGEHATPLEDQ